MFPYLFEQFNNFIRCWDSPSPSLVHWLHTLTLARWLPCSQHHMYVSSHVSLLVRKLFPRLLIFYWPELNILLVSQLKGISKAASATSSLCHRSQVLPRKRGFATNTHFYILVCVLPNISFLQGFICIFESYCIAAFVTCLYT